MSRILMTTLGSYGDLHPYLAMARVLKQNGDEVTIATHAEYREAVERIGARFVLIKPGLDDLGPEADWAAKANHTLTGTQFIIRTLILPYLEDSYQRIKAAAFGQNLIISHLLTFATPIVAEELGIPWLSCALQPSAFFSAYDPPALGPRPFLPKLRFLGPQIMRGILKLLIRPTYSWLTPITELRARVGLPPSSKNALVEGFSPEGTLALFPAPFAAPKPDWPARVHQIGFPLYDVETTSELSPAVQQFLEQGPPPVIFTLGTAIIRMETNYFEVAYEALKHLGLRGVFLVGKTPRRIPPAAMTDPRICITDYEPFSRLFPKGEVIVHQCGIGTTAQGLASGRPQILVPFAHDQPDNARRLEQLGVGITIPARRLNSLRLIEALNRVNADAGFATRAGNLASRLEVAEFDQRHCQAISGTLTR